MPLRILLCILSLLLIRGNTLAQITGNIWYFNDSLGLKFNDKSINKLFDGVTNSKEGTSVFCADDSLVVYSDGKTIWNFSHKALPPSNVLAVDGTPVQSCLFLKQPGQNTIYIFTTDEVKPGNISTKGINASTLSFQNTPPFSTYKSINQRLINGSNEGITAKRARGFDGYWIIASESETKNIHVYRLDRTGLSLHSVQEVLPFVNSGISQIKVSSNGKYIALCTQHYGIPNVVVFDFDNSTGTISSPKLVKDFNSPGLEFSVNEKFLYLSGYSPQAFINGLKPGVYQLCIDSLSNSQILNSSNSTFLFESRASGKMSVTPHEQILIALSTNGTRSFSSIQKPNVAGLGCAFLPNHINFNSIRGNNSIPNICIDYILKPYFQIEPEKCIDSVFNFRIHRNRADSVTWFFGDGSQLTDTVSRLSHQYLDTGEMTVSIVLHYSDPLVHDTISKTLHVHGIDKPNLGNDTLICSNESVLLSPQKANNQDVFIWNNKDTQNTLLSQTEGLVTLSATNGFCIEHDSIWVYTIDCGMTIDSLCYRDSTVISMLDQSIDSIHIDFGNGLTHQGQTSVKHRYAKEGQYVVQVNAFKNGLFRTFSDSFEIIRLEEDFLMDSLTACSPPLILNTLNSNDYSYSWNTGEQSSQIRAEESGLHILTISEKGCTSSDSIWVNIEDCACIVLIPNSFSPNGDGTNDVFTFNSECNVSNARFQIYNRWGELIHSDDKAWSGDYRLQPCPTGVYYWAIRYIEPSGKSIHKAGIVHLLR